MDFKRGQVGNIRPAKRWPEKRPRVLPESAIHGKDALSKERKGRISPHRLHAIVLKVGGGYSQQIRRVDRANGTRALHYGPKGITIVLVATIPAI